MSFELVYTRRAARDIRKLDEQTRKRIGRALLRFRESPLDPAEKLTDARIGSYRLRVGDYRVVFDIEGKDIVILRVGHRREIYRG